MNEKLIIEYLHLILDKKSIDAIQILKDISTLNYQIEHFLGMNKIYQIKIIEQMIKDVKNFQKNTVSDWTAVLKQLQQQRINLKWCS